MCHIRWKDSNLRGIGWSPTRPDPITLGKNTDTGELEAPVLHELKNHLSIIIGFCEMVLSELPDTDPKHDDLMEIRKAGDAAIALLPELSKRVR